MHGFMVMLLTCSVVMSLIGLAYMAMNPLLARRYSAKGRYYAWLIILAGLIIPFRPQWDNALIRVDVPGETAQHALHSGDGLSESALPSIFFPMTLETAPVYAAQDATWAWAWWQAAFVIWLAGLIAFLGFHLANHYCFTKRVRRWSRDVTCGVTNALLEDLKAEMGISRRIGLAVCEGIGSPVMLGFARPKILLPAIDMAHDELCFILKHELVHYKRRDLLYKCLVLAASAIHWFNPAVYIMAKAINAQCELSCDEEIVQNADDDTRQQYSEAIIGVVRYQSRFKTALSTTFYGGRKGMKNRITSIMTTNKKRATIGSVVLAFVLTSVLAVGTLMTFAAERPQYEPEPEIGRYMQNIGRRTNGELVLNPEWQEKLENGEIVLYELDQVTPFDFTRTIAERLADGQTIFRIDAAGRLAEWEWPSDLQPISAAELSERLGMPAFRFGMTLEDLRELGFDVEFFPTIQQFGTAFGSPSYELMRERGKSPIVGANGAILMWVDQSFFEMSYEEFNELAEQLLTTAFIIQTQETVDVLREHWLAAQW